MYEARDGQPRPRRYLVIFSAAASTGPCSGNAASERCARVDSGQQSKQTVAGQLRQWKSMPPAALADRPQLSQEWHGHRHDPRGGSCTYVHSIVSLFHRLIGDERQVRNY